MNEDLYYSLHDIIYDITSKSSTEEKVQQIVDRIPKNIMSIGESWGYYDTVFKDLIFNWFNKK